MARWKEEEPARWRTLEELDTGNMIEAAKSPSHPPDPSGDAVFQTALTAVDDHHLQKTLRNEHVGLGRTMSTSANKNSQNQRCVAARASVYFDTLTRSV